MFWFIMAIFVAGILVAPVIALATALLHRPG